MADVSELQAGQRWAYRTAASSATFHEALVLTVGTNRPPRVRIELVDDDWQGERRWVSPARLEVLWDGRDEYLELDRKIRALRNTSVPNDELDTVGHIFLRLIPLELAEFNYDRAGTTSVLDVPGLAAHVGLSQEQLRAAPAAVLEQVLHAPWSTSRAIARAAATLYPQRLLEEIEAEERRLNEDLVDGTVVTDFDGVEHRLDPEAVRRRYEKRIRPWLDRLRGYLGEERSRDLLERRDLIDRLARVTRVARRALEVLQPTQKRIVAELRTELDGATADVDFTKGD